MNFACLSASFIFSSFESVDDPSSNCLKVGEVSSVPLSESLPTVYLQLIPDAILTNDLFLLVQL